MDGRKQALVPSSRLREEADKRRELQARCERLEREHRAFRIAIVALGADPKEIIATLDAN